MNSEELVELERLLKKAADSRNLWLVVDGDTYPVASREIDLDLDHIKIVFN